MDRYLLLQMDSNTGFCSAILQQRTVGSLLKYTTLIAIAIFVYSYVRSSSQKATIERSHTAPYTLPLLRCTIAFVFDGLSFLRDAS